LGFAFLHPAGAAILLSIGHAVGHDVTRLALTRSGRPRRSVDQHLYCLVAYHKVATRQKIASVTADGAFGTRKCHDAIAAREAAAIIPPRKNTKPWKPDTPGAIARKEALRASPRFGRTIWRRWSGYHRRSRVETKMHGVKLLGQRPMARASDRQVAEFQVRGAVLNGVTALDIPVTEVVG
jgi:hypothetical protein